MDLYLIRHAHAGSRGSGPRDKWRPLSDKGHTRARELAELLADVEVGRLISSPATRCVQTIEPLAAQLALDVEEHDDLWEGADIDNVFELLEKSASEGAVLSSHGDIIPEVIDTLSRQGVPVSGRGCEKGSIWILSHDGSSIISARYISKRETSLN